MLKSFRVKKNNLNYQAEAGNALLAKITITKAEKNAKDAKKWEQVMILIVNHHKLFKIRSRIMSINSIWTIVLQRNTAAKTEVQTRLATGSAKNASTTTLASDWIVILVICHTLRAIRCFLISKIQFHRWFNLLIFRLGSINIHKWRKIAVNKCRRNSFFQIWWTSHFGKYKSEYLIVSSTIEESNLYFYN